MSAQTAFAQSLGQITKFRHASDPAQLETVAVFDALTLAVREQQPAAAADGGLPAPVYYMAACLTALSERAAQQQPPHVTRDLLCILALVRREPRRACVGRRCRTRVNARRIRC